MLSRRRGGAAIAGALAIAAPSLARADEPPAPEPSASASTPAEGAPAELSIDATPKPEKKRKRKDQDGVTVPWHVTATAGMLSGAGTLVATAATTGVAAEVAPTWQRDRLELAVPLQVDHRQTFGASLVTTDGRGGVAATYRNSPRLRLGANAEVRGVWKPDWPDQYQPVGAGMLGTTDRYSHLDTSVGASVTAIPLRHWHARVAWALDVVDYADDPSFNMIDEPTHLVPGDHTANALKGDWRYFGDGWKAGVGLDFAYASYDKQYARDAGTGLTHAGAGGPPPNPFYKEATFEPRVGADVDLAGGAGELDVSYGYEIVNDTYQGYYSYRGHHPEAALTWRVGALETALKADLKWRTYGPDSYAAGGNHPPLEYGDRRVDRRFGGGLDVHYALTSHWAVLGEADAIVRRTNFPNYVPNVFPASRQYDIEWSYENYVVQAGLEYRP